MNQTRNIPNQNKKIYYWSSNNKRNNGEGILSKNFQILLKKKYKNSKLINLNKFKLSDSFFYNYILPFWGVLKIWVYFVRGFKTCYINYLPIWNILLIGLLPKKTILGPITGTNSKKNIFYNLLKYLGITLLKLKYQKLIFSHSQFKKYFFYKKNYFYNFILSDFKLKKKIKKKKYDIIFYFKNNSNKGNKFLIEILLSLSEKYKIIIIGDKFSNSNNFKIKNFANVTRKKAIELIKKSKFGLISKENTTSYFAIDCLSNNLRIFYNKDIKFDKTIKSNMFVPINFNSKKETLKIIKKYLNKNFSKNYFVYRKYNYLNYF